MDGSVNVDPGTVFDGNHILSGPAGHWVKVVGSDDFPHADRSGEHVTTFYLANGEEITVPDADQIAVLTEDVPATEIRPDDDVKHPESGDWVKLYNIGTGTIETRTALVHGMSRTLTFYYEEDSGGHGGEFVSHIEIPGEVPASETPKNAFITRRVRDEE